MLLIENVETLYFGRLVVLRGVSLSVAAGRIVTVLGSNGAGKTTLLKTVLGLLRDQPDKGRIVFAGKEITRRDPAVIASLGIGYVPEGRGVFPEFSVRENLLLGALRRRDRHAVSSDLAAVTDRFPILEQRARIRAGLLSGGEQQMLAIGRALMARPRLLLLDEPSLGLAPRLVGEIFRVLTDLNGDGATLLLVEQNAQMALSIAHYGYVLEAGRIVLEGDSAALAADENVREMYLGTPRTEFRKLRKRRRWA
jgi:branched-chain amino acid transport system ATP-binding protein